MLGLMPKVSGSSHSGCFTAEAYQNVYSMVRVTLPTLTYFLLTKSLADIGMKPSSPVAANWPCSAKATAAVPAAPRCRLR